MPARITMSIFVDDYARLREAVAEYALQGEAGTVERRMRFDVYREVTGREHPDADA